MKYNDNTLQDIAFYLCNGFKYAPDAAAAIAHLVDHFDATTDEAVRLTALGRSLMQDDAPMSLEAVYKRVATAIKGPQTS